MDLLLQTFISYVKMIRITDLIDIGIIAFLAYKLIWITRRNSFGRFLKGIGLILLMMAVASALRLYAVSYLFSFVVEWGVLALIVLFQPEIRRMLERMGDSHLLNQIFSGGVKNADTVEQAIGETVSAYSAMSADKVGALIVFERQNDLDDVIKTGTALDCTVSGELLKNLFWNKAPLHDGAVVVRGGRIVGAGCMLPMSGNVNLSRDLGMRHRAGIGISETTDAVAAIVSEETGAISVAVGGMLKRHLTAETLERLLRNELLTETAPLEPDGVLPALSTLLGGLGRKGENGHANQNDQQ